MEEVWFAGVHTDVGGGAIRDNRLSTPSLARIPLRWMIRECFRANTGIIFDACMLQAAGLAVHQHDKIAAMSGDHKTCYLAEPYAWTPAPSSSDQSSGPVDQSITVDSLKTLLRAIFRATRKSTGKLVYEILPRWWPFSKFLTKRSRKPYMQEEFPWRVLPLDFESTEELKDIQTPVHCELERKPLWMALELIPNRVEQQTAVAWKMKYGKSFRWMYVCFVFCPIRSVDGGICIDGTEAAVAVSLLAPSRRRFIAVSKCDWRRTRPTLHELAQSWNLTYPAIISVVR